MHSSNKQNLIHRTLSAWLAIVLAITQTGLSPAMAQSAPDIESPIIELEAVFEADAGETQIFTALVADDKQLKDVTLYHRRAGRQAFDRAAMLPLSTTGYFSVDLPTDPTDLRAIEYYVQARDEGGNRSISGFAFDPYKRIINARATAAEPIAKTPENPVTQATVANTEVATDPASKSSNRKWWVAAAVLVGVVLASGSSSSSGGSPSNDPGRTELTINLPLPQ